MKATVIRELSIPTSSAANLSFVQLRHPIGAHHTPRDTLRDVDCQSRLQSKECHVRFPDLHPTSLSPTPKFGAV